MKQLSKRQLNILEFIRKNNGASNQEVREKDGKAFRKRYSNGE